jgi:cell division protein FtsB
MAKPTLTKQYRKSRLARLIVPVIALGFLGYFAMHAQSGRYGLEAKEQLERSRAASQARYDDLRRQREALEQRVQLLHDGTLDRDMIDERARRALNFSSANEIVIMR